MMAADEFAAALVDANPDWTGDPPEPDADGIARLRAVPASGAPPTSTSSPTAETSGAVIVAFTIDYVYDVPMGDPDGYD